MPQPVYILGISCLYHDAAAVLLKDGEIVFAAQEERFTRKKQDESIPVHAVERALKHEGISIANVSAVVFYEKPLLKFFERILPTYFNVWPRGFLSFHHAMQEWMPKKLWTAHLLRKELGYKGELFFTTHHESHAASSFYASGFDDATIVTVDGVGEMATTTIGSGKGTTISIAREIHFPHSLGLLYSAITYYLGFRVNSAEYKVMGLAPYGNPTHMEQMRRLITLHDDGSFALNMRYFTYAHGMRMTGKAMEKLFGHPRRKPEGELTQFHKDVARSLQVITEEAMLGIVRHAKALCPSQNLCLAGGVALNCVANGAILRSGLFRNIFIQPASGDAGGAAGAALAVWHKQYKGTRMPKMQHVFLGTEYDDADIETLLQQQGIPYQHLPEAELIGKTAALLEGENVIGWFQGRMEYGPRALGSRSILADARNRENWQKVNLKIKFRESFRPFAPVVLEEHAHEYFALDRESPYMLLVADVHEEKRKQIPAVTHVDGTARIQTIRREQHPRYYDLIRAFYERTGCLVLINTSFNVRGEPIVESPADALNCFLHTYMDYLAIGNFLLCKKDMPPNVQGQQAEYLAQFQLD